LRSGENVLNEADALDAVATKVVAINDSFSDEEVIKATEHLSSSNDRMQYLQPKTKTFVRDCSNLQVK